MEYSIDIFYNPVIALPDIYFSLSELSSDGKVQSHIVTIEELEQSGLELYSNFETEEQKMGFLSQKYHPVTGLVCKYYSVKSNFCQQHNNDIISHS
jgi:hypothetical protein